MPWREPLVPSIPLNCCCCYPRPCSPRAFYYMPLKRLAAGLAAGLAPTGAYNWFPSPPSIFWLGVEDWGTPPVAGGLRMEWISLSLLTMFSGFGRPPKTAPPWTLFYWFCNAWGGLKALNPPKLAVFYWEELSSVFESYYPPESYWPDEKFNLLGSS